jgi:acyl-CoA synthetase (AMP-forming)/AMP-acid ligase II
VFGLYGHGNLSVIAAPMSHIGGIESINLLMVTGKTTGETMVIPASGAYESSIVLDALERAPITTVFLVPTL